MEGKGEGESLRRAMMTWIIYQEIDRIGFATCCRSRTRLGDLSCDLSTALGCNDVSLPKGGWIELAGIWLSINDEVVAEEKEVNGRWDGG